MAGLAAESDTAEGVLEAQAETAALAVVAAATAPRPEGVPGPVPRRRELR